MTPRETMRRPKRHHSVTSPSTRRHQTVRRPSSSAVTAGLQDGHLPGRSRGTQKMKTYLMLGAAVGALAFGVVAPAFAEAGAAAAPDAAAAEAPDSVEA